MFVVPEPSFEPVRRLSTTVERGQVVRHGSRLYVVLGFDPMGVVPPRVYLQDAETDEERTAFLSELLAA